MVQAVHNASPLARFERVSSIDVSDVQSTSHKGVGTKSGEHLARAADCSDKIGLHLNENTNRNNQPCQSNWKGHASISHLARTPRACSGVRTESYPSRWVEELSTAIKQLKTQQAEYTAHLKANLDTKFCGLEQRLRVSAESHSSVTDRLHAIEEHVKENVTRMATVESRLSAIEESIGGTSLADVHKLIDQHCVKHDHDTENIKANLNELGDVISLLSAHRAAQRKDMTNLRDEFECQLADVKDGFDTLSVTSASEISNLQSMLRAMEARFCKNGFDHAKLDLDPLSIHTSTKPTAFLGHEGATCAVGFRLAPYETASAIGPSAPGEPIENAHQSAANGVPEDQRADLSQEGANTNVERESSHVLHGTSQGLLTRTCYPIAE